MTARNAMSSGSIAPTFMSGNLWAKDLGPSGQHEDVGLKSRLPVSIIPDINVGAIERNRHFPKVMKIKANKGVVIGSVVRNLIE